MEQVTIFMAFFAGIMSFLSPCVLPLVPAYLSFISGVSLDDLKGASNRSQILKKVSVNSIAFILGFSVIFILLGASATVIGQFLQQKMTIIIKVAGVIIILFGLHMIGIYRIKFLNYEKRFHSQSKPVGVIGSFVIGLAFAFGWTPCIGPILAGILLLASSQETIFHGISLLIAYSLGLGVPLFITGIGLNYFLSLFDQIKRHFRIIELVSGCFLIIVGVLIFTNYFSFLSGLLMQWFPWLNFG